MQLVQRYLKDVGIEAELKIQEYGAFIATTGSGKFEGLAMGAAYPPGWEPDSILYGSYAPGLLRNIGHVNDATLTAMLKEQRRTKDLAARKQLIFDIQRYEAEQQYYVYLVCRMVTGSYQPYVKNYAPNALEEYGMAAAVLGVHVEGPWISPADGPRGVRPRLQPRAWPSLLPRQLWLLRVRLLARLGPRPPPSVRPEA